MTGGKLFFFRPVAFILLLSCLSFNGHAQLIDNILGQKRSWVQALLKPYRILDYRKEREVHSIENGIHQTVMFENDSCKRFYWAVTPSSAGRFKSLLAENGYFETDFGFAKDSLQLLARELNSGKATLYIASITLEDLEGQRDASGRKIVRQKQRRKRSQDSASSSSMPLMQQAIHNEETGKKPRKRKKDPELQWIGTPSGRSSVLGWNQ